LLQKLQQLTIKRSNTHQNLRQSQIIN